MISFNSKFNSKASNLGFFISNDLKFKSDKSVPESTADKINSFLKRQQKDNKKQISFDVSEDQKCFLIVVKKDLDTYEINNLGASFIAKLKIR